MRIINRGRRTGKTAMLISTAYVTGKPIITSTMNTKNSLLDMAERMGISANIEVYTINEWLEYHRLYKQSNEILVDNVELILGQSPPCCPKSPSETKILRTTIQGQKRILDSH